MRMQFSNKCTDCWQARAFIENYMSVTNTEKPKVSKWAFAHNGTHATTTST